ncbi:MULTISPECIES: alpha/beta hydrolase [unclassified Mycobacterium]|uniref:alpha/beta hydrolase n=1 Tax=unclassified Mycobacterium TaxID=2642494 RepID=UPI0029C9AB44|nr:MULTISPECIES: alpha/beta hydrolase [unclassified Mycobacterium]
MTVTIPQVQAAKPEALIHTASALGQTASSLSSQIDTQRTTIDGLRDKWQGPASDAAIAKAQPTLLKMQQIRDALNRAQNVLQQGGTALTQTRTNVLQTVGQLSGQGWQVGPDGTVSVRPGSPLDQYAKASPANAMKLQQLAATNSTNVKTLLAGFDTADRQLSQNLRTAVGGLDGAPMKLGPDGTPLPEAPPYDTGADIPVGKSPEEVKKWWDSVPPTRKQELLDRWDERMGNLDGIPVADRDYANQRVMERDIARPAEVAKSRGVTVEEVMAHPELYGMDGVMMDRYNNAVQVKKGLAHGTEQTGAQTYLQVYEPDKFGGAGRAAIAIGNPDDAANTAVMVPGTSHSVTEGWLSSDDATNVFKETRAADPGRPVSVIAWMGYDAPDSLIDPQVGQTGLAHQGGQLLASDVNALAATHHDGVPSHITAIGHSYGSTTVADAAAGYGMHVNDVVLVGCPGTDMASNASDFHLAEGGHVYVGAASTDPITFLGGVGQAHIPGTDVTVALGADPSVDGFGSTRFKAEVPGFTLNDHSYYYKPGTESLFSIGDIASGHGDALEHDGMTAPHRTSLPPIPFVPPIDFDPELYRTPTSGHHHQ